MKQLLYVLIGSAALVIIGAFLPWASIGFISANGIEGDGIFTLLLGGIAALVYFGLKNKPKVAGIIIAVAGILSIIISVIAFTSIGDTQLASVGGGLILTLIGSIGLVVSGFMAMRQS